MVARHSTHDTDAPLDSREGHGWNGLILSVLLITVALLALPAGFWIARASAQRHAASQLSALNCHVDFAIANSGGYHTWDAQDASLPFHLAYDADTVVITNDVGDFNNPIFSIRDRDFNDLEIRELEAALKTLPALKKVRIQWWGTSATAPSYENFKKLHVDLKANLPAVQIDLETPVRD